MSGPAPPSAASLLPAWTRMNVLMASRKRSALSMLESATSSACWYRLSSMVTVVLKRAPNLEGIQKDAC